MRLAKAATAFGAGLTLLAATGAIAGIRINTTPSVPMGLWQVKPGPPARGDIVLICPPDTAVMRGAHAAGYLSGGYCPGGLAPLLKPVAALPGDEVQPSPLGVVVNGRLLPRTAPMQADGSGRLLPVVPQIAVTVPAGEVWLLSSYNKASFDSRYFGPLRAERIIGVARPILTQGSLHD